MCHPLGVPLTRRGRLVASDGDVLRRDRRLRHHGRRVRVQQPVRPGVRREKRGAEHGAVQRRRVVRAVFRDHLRQQQVRVVQDRQQDHRVGDQPVSAQLGAPQRQRRVVQPAASALRHVAAGLGDHRHLPRRHRARALPARQVLAPGRGPVHHRRVQLLRARAHHQRGGQRLRRQRVHQGEQHRVDPDVQELGRQLAVPRRAGRPGAQLRRDHHRRAVPGLRQHRAGLVAVRTDLWLLQAVRLLRHHRSSSPATGCATLLRGRINGWEIRACGLVILRELHVTYLPPASLVLVSGSGMDIISSYVMLRRTAGAAPAG